MNFIWKKLYRVKNKKNKYVGKNPENPNGDSKYSQVQTKKQ